MSPHLSGKCDCGRRIHFPAHARNGTRWTCRRCGTTWVLCDRGDSLHWQSSKPPAAQTTFALPDRRIEGVGCATILAVLASTAAVALTHLRALAEHLLRRVG